MKIPNKPQFSDGRITEALENYFDVPVLLQSIEFVYALDLQAESVCFQRGLAEYLGYPPEAITMGLLIELLHPAERQKLARLEYQLQEFLNTQSFDNKGFGISVTHQLRKADGTYAKIWRKLYPFSMSKMKCSNVIYSLGNDASCFKLADQLNFQVLLPWSEGYDPKILARFFGDFLSADQITFTKRQLDALRVWSETSSLKLAAERLGLKTRTLETHLKLARLRIGAHRTIDALMYAQKNGWL